MSMSKEDQELMALLLEEEGFELEQEEAIPPRDPSVTPLLSYSQQRLWFVYQLEPENPAYNISSDVRMKGTPNVEVLERCFNEIIRRHEVLRTSFHNVNGVPVQQFHEDVKLRIPVIDLSGLPQAERDAEVERLLTKEVTTPFDLTVAPLMRLTLLKLDEFDSVLSLSIHHIVSDGWSSGVFITEMAALYEAFLVGKPSPLPELSIQFADFAHWHRTWFQGEVAEEQKAFWKQQLSGELPVLNLPTDRQRPMGTSFGGAMYKFMISEEIKQALAKLGHQEDATMFMILLTAYNILLGRYTGQEDLIVGSPIANRTRSELEPLIGFLANTLVLRTDLSGDPTFRELLGRVQKMALDAYAHQEMPFVKLVEEVSPDRSIGASPLVQSFFVLQNAPMPEVHLTDLTLSLSAIESRTAKFDLSLYLVEELQGISAAFEYNTDLFDESTMARWAGHTLTLLEAVVQNPDLHLSQISVLSEAERQQVLVEWNDNAEEYRQDVTIAQLFEEQVARTPGADAVVFGDERLTYGELNARAELLAGFLRKRGVGPEVLVGIHVERSLEMVVGLLGILKAGGAYVPLDPAYPADRLGFILEDVQATILLTQERLLGSLPAYKAEVICLDRDWTQIEQEGAELTNGTSAQANHLAYLIYTSGSTGRPKGVAIEHRNAVAMIEWAKGVYSAEQLAGVLASTSICFDLSVFELFLTMSVGGKVILAENALHLPNLPAKKEVTLINTVPSAITELLRMEAIPSSVRTINLAGEPLRRALVDQIYELETVEQVYNLYGPSEDTTYSTYTLVKKNAQHPITIGRPIKNTQVYLLDQHGQAVPIGVPAELHLGGDGLARGYLNREDLTQEKFIPNLFSSDPNARLYKTGDLARYLLDGDLEYMGRIDHQVKVRGFRIELGEIETVLNQHEAIREVVLLAREDVPGGEKRLVAYLVAEEGVEAPSVTDLRNFLGEKLPEYMIPSLFVTLEEMPLTPNGKVDRRAFPAPEDIGVTRTVEYVAPRNEMEQTLADICGDLLGLELVGVYDNFFELGGHSLLATQLISRVRQAFGVELPLRSLFKDPTVGTLAEVIAEQQARQSDDAAAGKPTLQALPREAKGATEANKFPASFSQQRLWFLEQFMPGSNMFNVPSIVRLRGQLDVGALEQSFAELTRRHESLRTTFDTVEGELMQIVHPTASAGMKLIDLRELPLSEQEARLYELVAEESSRPFDLVHGPLLRTTLVKQSEGEHVLLILLHHIITDGWSIGIFFYELTTLYASFAKGEPSPLPELSIQYVDYAHWQREWLQGEDLETQLSYWREQLGGELPVLQLPTDFPRPAVQKYQGTNLLFTLPKSLADGLTAWSQQKGVTLFMTLLGAFQTLLHRYTGQEDILVGSPIAGRNDTDIEQIIGFFVNTLVMRTDLSGDPTFSQLVERVRDVALGAYSHQELPFEKLVVELQPERNTSHSPVFQVMFVLQNMPSEFTMELPGLTMSTLETDSGSAQFDLMLTLTEREHEVFGKWQYNTDLFEETTVLRMVSHFQTLLEDVLANPEKKLSELQILTDTERKQLLVEFNDNRIDVPLDTCIHHLFAEQAARTPDAVAVVWGEERLTYRELDARAERVGGYLVQRGVGQEVLVGINMERSLEMVVGMLGILKAGGAYVPLDPTYPADRLGFIMEDAKVSVLLTQESLLGRLPIHAAEVICLDRDWALIEAGARSETASVNGTVAQSGNLAYVIYTSGSTGRPKGVAIEHRNAVALIEWAKGVYTPEQLAGVLASTSICFDLSVFELFVTLSLGGKVILAENALHLPHLPARNEVTLINTVPSAITELLRMEGISNSVRTINLAGEPLRRTLVEQLYKLDSVEQVYNLYGPSEDTTYSTFTWVERGEDLPVTIGRPITNTQVYLLDANGQTVPLGVPGELHLGGDGLARGYLNREDLTGEKFISNPFSNDPHARLYKTGDLAHYRADGSLEYLGRIDHQVKIRGFRIELGEIETVLGQHPAIRETVLLAREDVPGEKRLVAYLVSAQEQAPTVVELRSYLSEKLPEYMIPSAFVILLELPLTTNGKVDRKSLPAPDEARGNQGSTYVAPRDLVEMEMVKLWEEVLQVKPIGVHDNFFALGGHSLKALTLVGEVRKRFDVELPIVSLFQALTVADLCQRVRGEVETTATGCLIPLQKGDGTRAPLFLIHPQSGGVFCYFGLSQAIGAEETVYGLQAPGFEGEEALLTSIDVMADRYLEEIRRVTPHGPYRLAGWSLGGTVVYEMARRLEAQGEAVEFLGLIDVHTFGESNIVRNIEQIEHDWTEKSALKHLARSMNMDTALFDELDEEHGLKALLQFADANGVLPYGMSTETTWTQMRVQITHQVALDEYAWVGPIRSDIHLFCATELDAMHHALVDPQDWVSRTSGTIHVESISGDHHTIVEPPHVLKLAERMKLALEAIRR